MLLPVIWTGVCGKVTVPVEEKNWFGTERGCPKKGQSLVSALGIIPDCFNLPVASTKWEGTHLPWVTHLFFSSFI